MRSTAASRTATGTASTATLPRAERTTGGAGRSTAGATTGGVSRPSSLGSVASRDKAPKATTGSRGAVGKGGWAGYTKDKAERSQRYPTLDVDDKKRVVIRFAEAEPFAYIFRHWVDKRPYTCIGEECPLCLAGHRAKPVVYYNVITVDDNVLRVWELSADPTKKVHKQYEWAAERDRTLDDPGLYFVVSKAKGDNGVFAYEVERVRADALQEDTGLEPLSAEEIEEAIRNHGKGLFTDAVIYVNTRDDLADAVDKLSDED